MVQAWGTLIPHSPSLPAIPLTKLVISVGSQSTGPPGQQHIRVLGNKFLSRVHFVLQHDPATGIVLFTARSHTNRTFVNGCQCAVDVSFPVEPDMDNAPHQPEGFDGPADAPVFFVSVPNHRVALSLPEHAAGFTGFSLIRHAAHGNGGSSGLEAAGAPLPRVPVIRSGGQTGADQAALEWAWTHGLPYAGWVPNGRKMEDPRQQFPRERVGIIDAKYTCLKETPSGGWEQRTEWNVRDADGTVLCSLNAPFTGGTKFTKQVCERLGKPTFELIAAGAPSTEMLARRLTDWVAKHQVRVLNLAGPRASNENGGGYVAQEDSRVAAFVTRVLDAAFGHDARKHAREVGAAGAPSRKRKATSAPPQAAASASVPAPAPAPAPTGSPPLPAPAAAPAPVSVPVPPSVAAPAAAPVPPSAPPAKLLGPLEGCCVMIPRKGCLAGEGRHNLQLRIVRSLGGVVTDVLKDATVLVLDKCLDADEAVEALVDLLDWPAIHTEDWIPRCSIRKELLASECLHPSHCEVPRHKRTQTTPSSAMPSYSGSQDVPPTADGKRASGGRMSHASAAPYAQQQGSAGRASGGSAQGAGGQGRSARELEPRRLALPAAEAYPGEALGNDEGLGQPLSEIPEEDGIDDGDDGRRGDPESDADEDLEAEGAEVAAQQGITTKQLIVGQLNALAKVYKKGGAGGSANSSNWGRNQHWAHALGTCEQCLFDPVTAAQIRALNGKHGIGQKTVDKMLEIYRTGKLQRHEHLINTPEFKALVELQSVWGIAEKSARDLMAKGITTRAEILERTDIHKDLRPGSLHYLRHFDELKQFIPRTEIAAVEERIRELASEVLSPPPLRVLACGSYRRGSTTSTDVDIIVVVRNERDGRRGGNGLARLVDSSTARLTVGGGAAEGGHKRDTSRMQVDDGSSDDEEDGDALPTSGSYKLDLLNKLLARLNEEGIIAHDLSNPKDGSGKAGEFAGNFYMGICRCIPGGAHRRIDLRCFEEHEEAAALLHCTGSGIFNRCLQRVAIAKDMQLSEKGLCRAKKWHGDTIIKASGYVDVKSEQDIFEKLGLIYREPEQREGKPDVLSVETGECWFQKKTRAPAPSGHQQLVGPVPLPLPAPRN